MSLTLSLDEVSKKAVQLASSIRPSLTTREEAMFIAGFQECFKYISETLHSIEKEQPSKTERPNIPSTGIIVKDGL